MRYFFIPLNYFLATSCVFLSGFLWQSDSKLSAQNIAINTSGSAAAAANMLEVTQPAAAADNYVGVFARNLSTATNAYAIWAEATGATNKYALVVPSGGGYVGIGTTSPVSPLHIITTTERNQVNERITSAMAALGGIIVNRRARGVPGALTAVLSGDELGKYMFAGYDGSNYLITAQIDAVANGTIAAGSIPTDITFATGSTDLGYVERMRILSDGNVGVGTSSPAYRLDVDGGQIRVTANGGTKFMTDNETGYVYLGRNSAGALPIRFSTEPSLAVGSNLTSGGAEINMISTANPATYTGTGFRFMQMLTSSTYRDLVFMRQDGNVGIGTIAPDAALNVVSASYPVIRSVRSTAFTNENKTGLALQHKTSGNMTDGFGSQLAFEIMDNAGVSNEIADISGTREGADNSGALVFQTWNAGAGPSERMRVDHLGNVGIGTGAPGYKLDLAVNDGDGMRISSTLHATFDANAYENVMRPLTTNNTLGSNKPITTHFLQGMSFGTNYGSFQILANSTNSEPLVYWRTETINSGAWNSWLQLASYSSNGNLGLGTTAPTSLFHTSQSPLNDATNRVGNYLFMESRNNTSANIAAVHSVLTVEGSTNNGYSWDGQIGVKSIVGPNWGPITNAYAFYAQPRTQLNWHSITSSYGFYSATPVVVTNSSITDAYGVYIALQKSTNVTKGWGVYQANAADVNYFAGNMGIGCTNPTEPLYVTGNIKATGTILGGQAACSDIRWKKDFIPLTGSLGNVLKLSSYYYNWRADEFPENKFGTERKLGMKAQEVEKIYPELVYTDKDGYKYLDYGGLTPVLLEAIKEQQKIIEFQRTENEVQKKEIESLNNKFTGLESIVKTLQLQISSEAKK